MGRGAAPGMDNWPEYRRLSLRTRGFSRFSALPTQPAKASNPGRRLFMGRGAAPGMNN
jgi:hypothetical protein